MADFKWQGLSACSEPSVCGVLEHLAGLHHGHSSNCQHTTDHAVEDGATKDPIGTAIVDDGADGAVLQQYGVFCQDCHAHSQTSRLHTLQQSPQGCNTVGDVVL